MNPLEQITPESLKAFPAAILDPRHAKAVRSSNRGFAAITARQATLGEYAAPKTREIFTDTIADILHLAHKHGHDCRDILANAVINFREETNA